MEKQLEAEDDRKKKELAIKSPFAIDVKSTAVAPPPALLLEQQQRLQAKTRRYVCVCRA